MRGRAQHWSASATPHQVASEYSPDGTAHVEGGRGRGGVMVSNHTYITIEENNIIIGYD